MEVSSQLHAPAALFPAKEPRYPLHKSTNGLQILSGLNGEEENLTLPGLEIRSFGLPSRSHSLYRLRYSGSLE
jgi:hypothetical protein